MRPAVPNKNAKMRWKGNWMGILDFPLKKFFTCFISAYFCQLEKATYLAGSRIGMFVTTKLKF